MVVLMVEKVARQGPKSFDSTTQGFVDLYHRKKDGFPLEGLIFKKPSKPIEEMGWEETRDLLSRVNTGRWYQSFLTDVLNSAVKAHETGKLPGQSFQEPLGMWVVKSVINSALEPLKEEHEKNVAERKVAQSARNVANYGYHRCGGAKERGYKAERDKQDGILDGIENRDYPVRGKISLLSAYAGLVCAPGGQIVANFEGFKKRVDAENKIKDELTQFREELVEHLKKINPINQ